MITVVNALCLSELVAPHESHTAAQAKGGADSRLQVADSSYDLGYLQVNPSGQKHCKLKPRVGLKLLEGY